MNVDPTNHVSDLIEPFLVGGLNAKQREAFEAHIRDCPQCALSLSSARAFDASMSALLTDARPDSGLEDRVLASFRKSAPRPRLHPNVRRAAIGIAATIVLGGLGYVATNALESGQLPFFGGRDRYAAGQALSTISRDDRIAHSAIDEGPSVQLQCARTMITDLEQRRK